MQSIKNIYEKIYDFENLHKAWEEARKGKRYRDDVLIQPQLRRAVNKYSESLNL